MNHALHNLCSFVLIFRREIAIFVGEASGPRRFPDREIFLNFKTQEEREMKRRTTTVFAMAMVAAVAFLSCSPQEDAPVEPTVDRTPEEVFITAAGQEGTMLYSVTEHTNGRKLTFNKTVSYGGRTYSGTVLPDGLVTVFDLGTDRLAVTFDDGRGAAMDRMKILRVSQTDTAQVRGYIGEPATFSFDILENTGDIPKCQLTAEGVEASASIDGNRCTVSIMAMAEGHGKMSLALDNGLATAVVEISVDPWVIAAEEVQEEFVFPEEGGQAEFRIKGDMPDNVARPIEVSSDVQWLVTETERNRILVRALKSQQPKARQATVTVTMKGCSPVKVSFTQEDALDNGEGHIRFVDRAFRNACLPQADADGDGAVSLEEAEAVTALDVRGKEIRDITGVEYFRNLEALDFRDNAVEHADMLTLLPKLHCLDMEGNPLKTFDMSGCQFVFSRCRFTVERSPLGQLYMHPKYKVRFGQVNVSSQCDPWRLGATILPAEEAVSEDMTMDNNVKLLKTHTEGPGYPVILAGIHLIDKEVKDGNYKRMIDTMMKTICEGTPSQKPFKYADWLDFLYVEHVSPRRDDPLWEEHWSNNVDQIIESIRNHYGQQKMDELGNKVFFYLHVAGYNYMPSNGDIAQSEKRYRQYYGCWFTGSRWEKGHDYESFMTHCCDALGMYFKDVIGME